MKKRRFNIAGPCIEGKHYLIPALERCPEVSRLVEDEDYFVIHAARQSGKTTLLKTLSRQILDKGSSYALYCSLETVQGITDPNEGISAVISVIVETLRWHPHLKSITIPVCSSENYTTALKAFLSSYCALLDKPLVVLFDETDCLSEQTLISFLRQLRDGFINRNDAPFPSSIALVGMRDIRDYKAKIRDNSQTLGSASPFNVITKSLMIGNFTFDDIVSLYKQHTDETGQEFAKEAIERVFYWTNGQPWLVNAIARECIEEILNRDYSKRVTVELIDQAAETLLRRRDTHLDSLLERLKEDRVKRIVEPVILGNELAVNPLSDDYKYCIDLGILMDQKGSLKASNPLYAEVIIRTLSAKEQYSMMTKINNIPWINNGILDMNGLMHGFQQFWRENADAYVAQVKDYPEAAPHIILQAFLQRVINGGGQIIREYALGSMRLDLMVLYNKSQYPIEIKLDYQLKSDAPFKQLLSYMDKTGTQEGWLTVFSRDKSKSWDEKISWETREIEGKVVHLVRQ